ncbi:hypothetical protein [Xanthomonas vasicola]|nr:hypothetical protein [Xanthomonas vasicola]
MNESLLQMVLMHKRSCADVRAQARRRAFACRIHLDAMGEGGQ